MVYIHGGSFWAGSNSEITTFPDGLVLESVKNKLPVIHVSMNYRLGGESSCLACLTRTGCFGANYIIWEQFSDSRRPQPLGRLALRMLA